MKKYFILFLILTIGASHSHGEEMTVECLGHWGGQCNDLALYKDYACIGEGPDFTILDIKDPENPVFVSKIMLKGIISQICISGDLAYITHFEENGLQILDLTKPDEPQKLGYLTSDTFPRFVNGIQVKDGFAYLAEWQTGVRIIDVRDSNHPVFLSPPTNTSTPNGIFIGNNFVYIADGTSGGLRIFEISFPTPEKPVLITRGAINTPGDALDVFVTSGTAFLAEGKEGLRIYDVQDPDHPSFLGEYVDPQERYFSRIVVQGNLIFLSGSATLLIIDVSNPEEPVLKGETTILHYLAKCLVRDIYLFTIGNLDGLKILDVSNLSNLTELSEYPFSGRIFGVRAFANRAFLADGFYGFRILKVNNPDKISVIYEEELDGISFKIFYKDGYAYLANISEGLQIFDVRPHVPPDLLTTCCVTSKTRDVFIQDNLAYLACETDGLQIIDVSLPEHPEPKGSCETPGNAYEVCVSGNYAYVANLTGSLQIINVSNPLHPTLEGDLETTQGAVTGVCYYNDLVYFLNPYGLYIVDPQNPAKPEIVGTYLSEKSRYLFGVSVIADLAFIGTKNEGLEIIDVSDPSSPTLVTALVIPGMASDIDIHINQGLAYLANKSGGLYILGFSKIPNPIYMINSILGRDVPASNSVLDVNRDVKLDISDITTIINPELDPVSEP
jgi:hypothetical protein